MLSRYFDFLEAFSQWCSVKKKVFLKISKKNTVPESEACNLIKNENLAQVFSCEI